MVQVKISDGILEGEQITHEIGGTYYSFKGIPYAAPPVGDLRFKVSKIYIVIFYLKTAIKL